MRCCAATFSPPNSRSFLAPMFLVLSLPAIQLPVSCIFLHQLAITRSGRGQLGRGRRLCHVAQPRRLEYRIRQNEKWHKETGMGFIEVLTPVAEARVQELPLARRYDDLRGKTIGFLNNRKANAG